MRILMVVHHFLCANSGAAGSVLQIVQELRTQGHEVFTFSYDDVPSGWLWKIDPLRFLLFPRHVNRFVSRMKRRGGSFDVIDCASGDGAALIGRKHRRDASLLVFRSHGSEYESYQTVRRELQRNGHKASLSHRLRMTMWLKQIDRSAQNADTCIFLNRSEKDAVVDRLGLDQRTCFVVPQGVSHRILQAQPANVAAGQQLGIVFIGSFSDRKGRRVLTHALSAVLRERGEAFVRLLGTGGTVGDVIREFPSDVRARIEIHPTFEQDELPALLSGCTLTVYPPLAEGFGKGLVEAMASGCAAVASSVGGPFDILRDGAGLLVDPEKPEDFVRAIRWLLQDPPRRLRRACDAARRRALEYEWPSVVRQRVRCYDAAIRLVEESSA